MARKTIAAELAEETIRKFPKSGTKTLARKLYREHPELWPSLEACRGCLRRLRGAAGESSRRKVKPAQVRTPRESETCRRWGALIPRPAPNRWKRHRLPAGPKRWLIVADLHVPYHDKRALEACLRDAEGNCDGVIILGDAIDAYQLSTWQRDPRKRGFRAELEDWKKMLDIFRSFGPVVWKAGNHERRLETYLMRKAPELFDMPEFTFPSFCDLEAKGIVWVPPMDILYHHKLTLMHGHEPRHSMYNPVNPARGVFLRTKACTLIAHFHVPSHHSERTVEDRIISCWSLGCLCDLHPEYDAVTNKWGHGFGYLEVQEGQRKWNVITKRIVDGVVV